MSDVSSGKVKVKPRLSRIILGGRVRLSKYDIEIREADSWRIITVADPYDIAILHSMYDADYAGVVEDYIRRDYENMALIRKAKQCQRS